jgi:alpha-D-ribose 1-methylphosphonate 5-triphosphate synthase subunit PhnG
MTDGVRAHWMSVLAKAPADDLEAAFQRLAGPPRYRVVRGPEVGLVMVRARAGGTGTRFNLGEMTVTRCTVELADGTLGHAWVGGRGERHAEVAAVLDALLQAAALRPGLEAEVVAPLAEAQAARRRLAAERAAATKVDFFTVVRGD